MWRTRFLFPSQLDEEELSDRELFDRYFPLAQASDEALAAAMRAAFYHADLERYTSVVELEPGETVTKLSAFFARAKLWRMTDFDPDALEYIIELPAVGSAYGPQTFVILSDLVENDDFVPAGYAAPLVFAGVPADIIVAAHLDSMPLEFASLLGAPSF
jgi:hypothetical protein